MLKNKLFGIISLGCDKNRVDTEKIIAKIKSAGYAITSELEEANILIVNTCAFLESARKEAIDTVLECAEHKNGKLEKLVVCGCLPQKYISELFEPLVEADVFLGINDYDSLFDALESSYAEDKRVNMVGCGNPLRLTERVLTTPCHYAYLKIADGCNNFCSYCLIPRIRGKFRSTPIEALVAEASELGELSELILVAQDCTRYGVDIYGRASLVDLIQALSALDNIKKIRLLYCYPDMIDDGLINEIKNNDKLIKYIDIPLQHADDGILKLMNRKGTRDGYLQLIGKLKTEISGIAIRSTFICGFPSEGEKEFSRLIDFINQAKLFNCGFFEYSREPDTPAYKLKGQVLKPIKRARRKKLYEAQRLISRRILKEFVGLPLEVVCDGVDYERGCFVGRAYFNAPDIDGKVYFNAKFAEQGKTYTVLIQNSTDYDLFGKTEDYDELT